jgi:hypothetical protein
MVWEGNGMGTARERQGNGMGTAEELHRNGIVCVNPPLSKRTQTLYGRKVC